MLSVADTPAGAIEGLAAFTPTKGPLTGLWQTGVVMNTEKERKGPAEKVLQAYTAHMKEILSKNGLLK